VVSNIRVDVPRTLESCHALVGDAEGLRAELARLSQKWDDVISGWSGVAASSYAALWEEWHGRAADLVETLGSSSQLLERASLRYDEQETSSARTVRTIAGEIAL
jgi:WXG100 family type VII secretion target